MSRSEICTQCLKIWAQASCVSRCWQMFKQASNPLVCIHTAFWEWCSSSAVQKSQNTHYFLVLKSRSWVSMSASLRTTIDVADIVDQFWLPSNKADCNPYFRSIALACRGAVHLWLNHEGVCVHRRTCFETAARLRFIQQHEPTTLNFTGTDLWHSFFVKRHMPVPGYDRLPALHIFCMRKSSPIGDAAQDCIYVQCLCDPMRVIQSACTKLEYITTKTESFCIAFASVGIALHIGAPCNVATKVGTKSVLHQVQMRFGTLSNGCIQKSISLPWHRNLMINFHPTRHWNVPEDNDSRSQSC